MSQVKALSAIAGFLLGLCILSSAHAGETFPVQGRLFLATTYIKPNELNQMLSTESLKTFDKLGQYGVEITYPLHRLLDIGMRYGHRSVTTLEPGQFQANTSYANLSQDAILLLARVPLVRSAIFRFDVFGGVGGTNTTFEIKSATQDGKLTRTAPAEWVASPQVSYGASAGIGYKKFYLYVEGGYDHNSVSDLSRSGTVNSTVGTLQLSGRYFMIGLLFDGVSGTKK